MAKLNKPNKTEIPMKKPKKLTKKMLKETLKKKKLEEIMFSFLIRLAKLISLAFFSVSIGIPLGTKEIHSVNIIHFFLSISALIASKILERKQLKLKERIVGLEFLLQPPKRKRKVKET